MANKQQFNERSFAYDNETSFGVLASPTMKEMRVSACELNIARDYIENDEIDPERQELPGIAGIKRISTNDFSYNLSDYSDDILEACLQGSFNVGTFSLTAIDTGSKTITLVADPEDILPGETFAAQVAATTSWRDFHVASVTDNEDGTIDVVTEEDLNPESEILTPNGTETAKIEVLKLGSNQKSLLFEERYEDRCISRKVTGFTPGAISIQIQPNALVKVNVTNFLGKAGELQEGCTGGPSGWSASGTALSGATSITISGGTTNPQEGDTFCIYPSGATTASDVSSDQVYTVVSYATGTLTFTPALDVALDSNRLFFFRPATTASTSEPFTGTDTLGALREGGSAFSRVTSLTIDIDNQNQPDEVVFQDTIDSVSSGKARVSGSLTHYVQNLSLYKKFVEGTESSLQVRCENADAAYTLTLPRIKYDQSSEENLKGSLALNQSFRAYKDPDQGTTVRVVKTPVTGVSYT